MSVHATDQTMNCLSFRRAIATEPDAISVDMEAHLARCEACRTYLNRAQRGQRLLRQAARVPVPDGLQARILMSQAFRLPGSRIRQRYAMLAAAAMVIVVISATWFFAWPQYRQTQLESEVLALIDAAEYAMENRASIDSGSISHALEPVGYKVQPSIGDVSFAGRCLVRGALAGHLVVREQSAPITVFLVPHVQLTSQEHFGNATWSGVMMPASRGGAIVVVAGHDQELSHLAARVRAAVLGPA